MVLDQKWGVLFDSVVEIAFRLKASWNAPIFDFDSKKWIFCSQVYIWSFKCAKIMARLPSGFSNHKVWDVSFYWEKIINFETKFVSRRENENWRKNEFFRKKNQFWMKFENPPKNVKKLTFFSKKSWILFSLNFTSTNRKIILKLDLKSYGSTVYAFEALNAPKS